MSRRVVGRGRRCGRVPSLGRTRFRWFYPALGENDGVARNLFRSFVFRGAASIAKLDLTVKSHKGAGFVTFRNIHSLACYSLEGLSQ